MPLHARTQGGHTNHSPRARARGAGQPRPRTRAVRPRRPQDYAVRPRADAAPVRPCPRRARGQTPRCSRGISSYHTGATAGGGSLRAIGPSATRTLLHSAPRAPPPAQHEHTAHYTARESPAVPPHRAPPPDRRDGGGGAPTHDGTVCGRVSTGDLPTSITPLCFAPAMRAACMGPRSALPDGLSLTGLTRASPLGRDPSGPPSRGARPTR